MKDLLEKYGTRWVDLRKLRDGKLRDSKLVIGRNYVPPLGGVSVIDEEFVAGPEHRLSLEAAGFKPWLVSQQDVWSVWSVVLLVLVLVLSVLGCVSC